MQIGRIRSRTSFPICGRTETACWLARHLRVPWARHDPIVNISPLALPTETRCSNGPSDKWEDFEMKEEIDLNLVLVRQVSALVRETANILCDSPEPSEVLLVEAHLYRLLAVNCEEKARMAEELGRS